MNTDRKAKLEKALANYNSDSMFSVENYKGAQIENSRLAPLHAVLLEAVEALEEYSCECEEANHVTGLMKKMECYRCHVLSKIDKVLEEK